MDSTSQTSRTMTLKGFLQRRRAGDLLDDMLKLG